MPDKKIILITGANRGIGAEILSSLISDKTIVIGTSRSESGVKIINENIKKLNGMGMGFILDVNEIESIEALNTSIKAKFGVVSILVNNAGITKDNLLIRMSDDEWKDVVDTNLNSVFRVTKEFLKEMMKLKYGRIINISSVVGVMGNAGQTNYASTKAALLGFTKSLAKEVASRNITVNAVSPGFIETDMTKDIPDKMKQKLVDAIPLSRIGNTKELAAAVKFLASDDASYITGENINVNGGLYM